MPEDNFDFDFGDSGLQVGIELEWPRLKNGEKYASRGYYSNDLLNSMNRVPSIFDADAVYDGTVGLELVSAVIDVEDAENWTAEIIDYVKGEYGADYQPVGLLSNGNTAGMHVHLSPLSRSKAERLAELSEEPWMQVLFCTSIATDEDQTATWPVFRGGEYCRMGYADSHRTHGDSHYTCVNRRNDRHYEWRMPEPMSPENVGILARFLDLFKYDEDVAIEYAQELLDKADKRITSIRRAEAVGMQIDDLPEIRREPVPETDDFFYEVYEHPAMPEIHTVEYGGEPYYLLDSRLACEFEADGIQFGPNDVVHAESLDSAEGEVADQIRQAYNRMNATYRETDATQELKKIVKKESPDEGGDTGNAPMAA